tara:strand:+ start:6222 stop:7208 length:987 start_codon:yes stop_codon:yes gene_type:complete
MAATSYDPDSFLNVVGNSNVFKPISPVTGKPVVDEEEEEDEDDKQTRELDAMMGLSPVAHPTTTRSRSDARSDAAKIDPIAMRSASEEDDYTASEGDLEDVTPLYDGASGDDVMDNMLGDSTTSISAANKPTTVKSEDLTGLDIVGDRPSEVNMEDFIPFEPHGGDSSTRPFGELDDDPSKPPASESYDDAPTPWPSGTVDQQRSMAGLPPLDSTPVTWPSGTVDEQRATAGLPPLDPPTLPGDDMVKAMEPKFDKSALLDPTNFARQFRVPPETMSTLFKKTHGGKFDPNSKMDRLKMKTMETMIQEDKSLLGLSPTQFALKVYSRK